MADPEPIAGLPQPAEDEIAFDYIKANDFRSISADGAVGAVSASGRVHVALYVERTAIPRRQVFKVDPNTGELGELVTEHSRKAVVREMSCDIFLERETARELGLLLLRLVDRAAAYAQEEGDGDGEARKGV